MKPVCEQWISKFKDANLQFSIHNNGIHLKIGDWNFYPTTQTYYNGFTGMKGNWRTVDDVKRLTKDDEINPESVFKALAEDMLVRFDYEEFQEQNPRITDVIFEAMKIWRKIK
jgi:hypothetical protein